MANNNNFFMREIEKAFSNYPKCLMHFSEHPNTKQTIEELKNFVCNEMNKINSSQIRNLYATAKAVQSQNELQMLQPKFAYIAARQTQNKKQANLFMTLMNDLISKEIDHEEFKKLFEAIVAYHKYYSKS